MIFFFVRISTGFDKMIFQASRMIITANHIHSLKRINSVWLQSNFQRNMHLLLNKTLINGEWVSSSSNAEMAVTNPANGSIVGHVPDLNVSDVHKAIDAAHKTFHSDEWTSLTAKERSTLLKVCINFDKDLQLVDSIEDFFSTVISILLFFFFFRNGIYYLRVIVMKLLRL